MEKFYRASLVIAKEWLGKGNSGTLSGVVIGH